MLKFLRRFFLISIFFLVFVAGLSVLVNLPITHKLLHAILVKKVFKPINLNFSAKRISIEILPPKIYLANLKIKTKKKALLDESLIECSHSYIFFSWSALFLGKKKFINLKLSGLKFNPEALDEKLPQKNNSNSVRKLISWPPPELPLHKVTIEKFSIYQLNPIHNLSQIRSRIEFSFEKISLLTNYKNWADISTKLNIQSLNLSLDGNSILEEAVVQTKLKLNKNKLYFNNFKLKSPRLNLQGNFYSLLITEKNSDKTRSLVGISFQGPANLNGDLSLIASILDTPNTRGHLQGVLNTDSFISLDNRYKSYLNINGKMKVKNGYLDTFRLYNLSTKIHANLKKIRFSNISIKYQKNNLITGNGSINYANPHLFSFKLKTHKLPLSKLLAIFNIHQDSFDFDLDTDNLHLSGSGKPFNMKVKSLSQLSNLEVSSNQEPNTQKIKSKLTCKLPFDFEVSENKLNWLPVKGICKLKNKTDQSHNKQSEEENIKIMSVFHFDDTKGMSLKADIKNLDLKILKPFIQDEVKGQGDLILNISGPYGKLNYNLITDLKEISFRDFNFKNAKSDFSIKNDVLETKKIQLNLDNEYKLVFKNFKINLNNYLFSSKVETKSLKGYNLKPYLKKSSFLKNWNTNIHNLSLKLGGDIRSPISWSGEGSFKLSSLSLNNINIVDQVFMNFIFDQKKIEIKHLQAKGQGQSLKASLLLKRTNRNISDKEKIIPALNITYKDTIDFNFKLTPNSKINRKKDFISLFSKDNSVYSDLLQYMKLDLEGSCQGPIEACYGNLKGKLSNVMLKGIKYSNLNLNGLIIKSKSTLTFSQFSHKIAGRFILDWSKKSLPYNFYTELKQVDLRSLDFMNLIADSRSFFYLSGNAKFNGSMLDLENSQGKVNINSINIGLLGKRNKSYSKMININLENPVQMSLKNKNFIVLKNEDLVLLGNFGRLSLSLKNTNFFGEFSIPITAYLNLNMLTILNNKIERANGKLYLSGTISRSEQKFKTFFNLITKKEINDQKSKQYPMITLKDFWPQFNEIKLRATYEDGLVEIKKLTAKKGKGTLKLKGIFNLFSSTKKQSSLSLSLDKTKFSLFVPYIQSIDSEISGNIELSGTKTPYLIKGDVIIDNASSKNQKSLYEIYNFESTKKEFELVLEKINQNPLIDFDLNIKAEKNIHIQSQDLDLTLSADLSLQGDNLSPQLSGYISIDRGYVNFRREFQIIRGEISFTDPENLKPDLDILASTEIPPYKVSAHIFGNTQKPTVEFSVDPPSKEDGKIITMTDTVFLISKGYIPSHEGQIDELSSLVLSEVGTTIWKTLPIDYLLETFAKDIVHIYPDVTTDDNGVQVPRINSSVRLPGLKNVEVFLRKTPDQTEASVEVPIHNHITLSGKGKTLSTNQDDQAISSKNNEDLDFNVRFRFSFE